MAPLDNRRRDQYDREFSPTPSVVSTESSQHYHNQKQNHDGHHQQQHRHKDIGTIAKSRVIIAHPGIFTGCQDTRIIDTKLWLYRVGLWAEDMVVQDILSSSKSSKSNSEREKLRLATQLFDGPARKWWEDELDGTDYEEATTSWKAFERAFLHKFLGPQTWGDAIDKIEDLKHSTNMSTMDFIEEFKQVISPFNAVMSLDEKIMRFVSKIQPLPLRHALRSWLGSEWWNRRDTTKRIVCMEDVYRWVEVHHTGVEGTSIVTPDSTPVLTRHPSPVTTGNTTTTQRHARLPTPPSAVSNGVSSGSRYNFNKRPSTVLEEDIVNMVKKTRMMDDDIPDHHITSQQENYVYPNATPGTSIHTSQSRQSYSEPWPHMNNENIVHDNYHQQKPPILTNLPPVMQPMMQALLSPPPYPINHSTAPRMPAAPSQMPIQPPQMQRQPTTLTPTIRANQVLAPPGTTVDWSPALSVGSVGSSGTSFGPPGIGNGSMMNASPMMTSGSPNVMHMQPVMPYDPMNFNSRRQPAMPNLYSNNNFTTMSMVASRPYNICHEIGHLPSQCPRLDIPYLGGPGSMDFSMSAPGAVPTIGGGVAYGSMVGMPITSATNKTMEVQNLPPHMRVRKCYNCRKPGHKASDCPEPLRNAPAPVQPIYMIPPATPGPPGLV